MFSATRDTSFDNKGRAIYPEMEGQTSSRPNVKM